MKQSDRMRRPFGLELSDRLTLTAESGTLTRNNLLEAIEKSAPTSAAVCVFIRTNECVNSSPFQWHLMKFLSRVVAGFGRVLVPSVLPSEFVDISYVARAPISRCNLNHIIFCESVSLK
jgi:hypothetical protein